MCSVSVSWGAGVGTIRHTSSVKLRPSCFVSLGMWHKSQAQWFISFSLQTAAITWTVVLLVVLPLTKVRLRTRILSTSSNSQKSAPWYWNFFGFFFGGLNWPKPKRIFSSLIFRCRTQKKLLIVAITNTVLFCNQPNWWIQILKKIGTHGYFNINKP